MKQVFFTITENEKIAQNIHRMKLAGDVTAVTAPGQFINIKLDGHFLRRPISVCDVSDNELTIIYKVLGAGTEEMTHLTSGDNLDVLTGLGNGYNLDDSGDNPLLVGGGVGIPPLYLAARLLKERGKTPSVILGFNTSKDIYYVDEFEALGCEVTVATSDGSRGIKGLVTDAFRAEMADYSHFYTCGPLMMLKAVYNTIYINAGISGQMSFEERMGCGFGACMGCSVKTKTGYKRICKDGPVLRTEEILW